MSAAQGEKEEEEDDEEEGISWLKYSSSVHLKCIRQSEGQCSCQLFL